MAATYSLVVIGSFDGQKGDAIPSLSTPHGGFGDYDNVSYTYRKIIPWNEGWVVTLVSGCPDLEGLKQLKHLLETGQYAHVSPAVLANLQGLKCKGDEKLYLIMLDTPVALFQ